jgi:hypothetical protein
MNRAHKFSSRFFISSLSAALVFSACSQKAPSPSGDLALSQKPSTPIDQDPALALSDSQIVSLYSDTSCTGFDNPVGEGGTPVDVVDYDAGLKARVTVPPAGFDANDWGQLDRFAEGDAVQLPETLFFHDLNVPTRAFTAGFPLLSGDFVTDANGDKLIEYFRMDFNGFLTPPEGTSSPKNMEFAILADDGVRMKMGENEDIVLESPGVQQTKLVCGSAPVNFAPGEHKPLEVSWFQGPRYHIALVMLWREAQSSPEPLCSLSGNDYWFHSDVTPSAPQAPYQELLTRGWQVVPAANFQIPHSDPFNPCLSQRVQRVFAQPSPKP